MKLIRFELHERPHLGVWIRDRIYDMPSLFRLAGEQPPEVVLQADLKRICAASDSVVVFINEYLKERIHELERLDSYSPGEVKILPPIPNPDKIICIGLNYQDHCEEQKKEPPKTPVLFAKFANSICGHGDEIVKSPVTDKMDFEGELGVIIGAGGRKIPEERALDHVFGYTIINDVSARDIQRSDGQWLRAKSQDTFCPSGPCVVTADEIPDPQALEIHTRLNGETMQHSNTGRMIFHLRRLISFISEGITLNPGDIISTGTPSGVGLYREPQVFLKHGDLIEIEISGIGRLANPVVEPLPS